MAIKRIVPIEELPEWAHFQASLSKHRIIEDEHGTYRYEQNRLIDWLWRSGKVDLNVMRIAYCHGAFSREEYMQFYRDMGYSLSGFEEIFGEELDKMEEEQG
jgi:hypothetical protein